MFTDDEDIYPFLHGERAERFRTPTGRCKSAASARKKTWKDRKKSKAIGQAGGIQHRRLKRMP